MYNRGDSSQSHGQDQRSQQRPDEDSQKGGERNRDYHKKSSRRDSNERRRDHDRRHSRSRSSSRDRDSHRRRHRHRRERTPSRSSSSSRSNSPRRPSFKESSESNPKVKVDGNFAYDQGAHGAQYNLEYKPPSGIFEDDQELQAKYSSGVNPEAPIRYETEGSRAFQNQRLYDRDRGGSRGAPSSGISMKLTTSQSQKERDQSRLPYQPTSAALTSLITPKIGSVFANPTKLVSSLVPILPSKSTKVASIFNDDDDEPEEMPAECKMRMKNVGRETPTSAGPNSFGKTKIGFCNVTHINEKKLEGPLPTKKK